MEAGLPDPESFFLSALSRAAEKAGVSPADMLLAFVDEGRSQGDRPVHELLVDCAMDVLGGRT